MAGNVMRYVDLKLTEHEAGLEPERQGLQEAASGAEDLNVPLLQGCGPGLPELCDSCGSRTFIRVATDPSDACHEAGARAAKVRADEGRESKRWILTTL